MISGINLFLQTTEAAILARAAEAAAAERRALVNSGTSGQTGKVVEKPPRLGIFALRPPPDKAALLGSVAMHRRAALLLAQPPREQNAETYDRINAIATDLRIGQKLSVIDRMGLLAAMIHDDDFSLTMLPYLVDVFCDLAGVLSDARLKESVMEAGGSFKIFSWDNNRLDDGDWVIFANETLRLFHDTPFLYEVLAELYSQRSSPTLTNSSVLDSISLLPKLSVGVAGEVATAALAHNRFTDEDFADALGFITAPALQGLVTEENAVHQIAVIANVNHNLTTVQLGMLMDAVLGLNRIGADPILSGWTLARIAGHPNYPTTSRLETLVSLARNIRWPIEAIDELILAVAYATRNDTNLRNIPTDLVAHLRAKGIHIGEKNPETQKPAYRTNRALQLVAWIEIWRFFQPYRLPATGQDDPEPWLQRNVA